MSLSYLSPAKKNRLQYGSVTNEADGSAGNAAVLRGQEGTVKKPKRTDQIAHLSHHDNPKHHKPVAKINKKDNPAKLPKKEGGPGSGRHATVGDAVDRYNAKRLAKLEPHTVKKQESVKIGFRRGLREADVRSQGAVGNKFSVILIQEGLGNLRDAFYYTKECLQVSAAQFEGVKCFADHADAIQEEIHPERSTRDILGHFEDVHYVESQGRGALAATLILCEGVHFEWANSLLTNALEYAHKYPNGSFVGLSINASGEAGTAPIEAVLAGDLSDEVRAKLLDAQAQGVDEVRPVTILKEAVSCDLVTEPGAGGKILAMMERNKKPMKKKPVETKEAKGKGAGEADDKKKKPAKAKEAKQAHEEAEEGHEGHEEAGDEVGGDSDGDGDEDHADADQDKALFKKMLSQYLGDDADGVDEEEALKMCQAAHEHYMKQGMESHEAYEAAGNHMKASLAIGKALKAGAAVPPKDGDEEEEESHEAGSQEENEEEGSHEESQDPPPNPKASKKGAAPMPQEANRMSKELVGLKAENARLRESVNRLDVERYLDKKLAGLADEHSAEFMKKLREAIGKPKSKAHIEETCAMFIKAYEAGREDADASEEAVFTEKSGYRGDSASDGLAPAGLGDCLN